MSPLKQQLEENRYDVCMVLSRHAVRDQRAYHKQAYSLHRERGLQVLVAYLGEKDSLAHDEHCDVLVVARPGRTTFGALFRYLRILFRVQARVFHIHDFDVLCFVPLLRWFKRARTVYDVHENYVGMIRDLLRFNRAVKPVLMACAYVYERVLSRLAHRVIIVVENHRPRFLRYGVRPERIELVMNYPKLEGFAELPVVEKEFDLVYCGSTNRQRGLFELADFLVYNEAEGTTLLAILAGNQAMRDEFKAYVDERGITSRVTVLEQVPHEQIPALLTKARVGTILLACIPKYREGIAVKTLEYSAAGLPVLSNAGNLFRDWYIQTYDCGVLVDDREPETIRAAYETIMRDYDSYAKRSRQAVQNHSWKKEGGKLATMYDDLLPG